MSIKNILKKFLALVIVIGMFANVLSAFAYASTNIDIDPISQPEVAVDWAESSSSYLISDKTESTENSDKPPPNLITDKKAFNQAVSEGAIQNKISKDGNPKFPLIDLDRPFVDTTSMASQEFLAEIYQKSEVIQEKGYQFGGFIYYDSPKDIWEVGADFGNHFGIGNASKDNGLALVVALHKQGKNGYSPAAYLAVGEGIEGLLPDTSVTNIFKKVYTPTLEQTASWEEALLRTMDAVIGELNGEGAYKDELTWVDWVIIILLLTLFIIIIIFSDGSGGSYSGCSSGGFSGGGFGGGGFGGGGGGS